MSTSNENKRPTHSIFQVLGEGDKAIWVRIGAAWLHGDTRGANLVLNSIPLTGRIVMREAEADANAQSASNGGR